MNEFGEPNMGNPSVRFDEGRERVGHWPLAFHSNGSCLLYVTEDEEDHFGCPAPKLALAGTALCDEPSGQVPSVSVCSVSSC
jgi:hypothetical protein